MNPLFLCFECPSCKYDGAGKYLLVIKQVRDVWEIGCNRCRTVTAAYFDDVIWLHEVVRKG